MWRRFIYRFMIENKMVRTIKEIHYKDVCLFRVGNFFHAFGKDADIISYVFEYKIKEVDGKIRNCGFPVTCIEKTTKKLNELKINYLLLDRRNNYEVEERKDNKDLNRYDIYSEKARKYINTRKRIAKIYESLIEIVDEKEQLNKIRIIEECLYEGREF